MIDVVATGTGGRQDTGAGDGRTVIAEHRTGQYRRQHRQHQTDVAGRGHVAGQRQHDAKGAPAGTGGKRHGAREHEHHGRQHFDRQVAVGQGSQVLAGLHVAHHGADGPGKQQDVDGR